MDPQPGPGNGRQPLWPAAALSGLLAVLWLWPSLACGFLNDDFLIGYYLDQEVADPRLNVERVAGELTGPFFGVPFLYRPFVTLSIAANLALGGADPFGFHLWNLLLTAGAAVGTGLLCAMHAPKARAPAALLGAALIVLHPAAVEPTFWISGRTSTQAVCFAVLCMAAFAGRLRGRLRTPWLELLCAIPALGSREEAVMLPVSLLALDLLHRPRRAWRERLRLHLPVALTVLGYLALRLVFLGGLAPGRAGGLELEAAATNLLHRVAGVPWPAGGGAAQAVTGGLLLLALLAAAARRPFVLLVGIAWTVAVLAPTLGIAPREEAMGGRFTWPALPVLAVVVAAVAWLPETARPGMARIVRGVLLLATAAAVVSWAPLSHRLIGHYRSAAEQIETMQAGLLTLGADVEPRRPLAITSLRTGNPLRLVHSKAFFPLVERPFAPRDVPVAGLGFVLDRDANAPELYLDPSAVYAFAEIGSPIARWDPRRGGVRSLDWPEPVARELTKVPDQPWAYGAEGLAPLAFEQLVIRVPDTERGDVLVFWWTEPLLPEEWAHVSLRASREENGERTYLFDLTRHLGGLLIEERGLDLRGFLVEGPDRVLSVRVEPRVRELTIEQPLAGESLGLAEAETALRAPRAYDPGSDMRLVVVGPTSGWSMPVLPGEPVRLEERILGEMVYARDVARQQPFYFFFQAAAARSGLDWFRLRDNP